MVGNKAINNTKAQRAMNVSDMATSEILLK
jgi:hypothetical protein